MKIKVDHKKKYNSKAPKWEEGKIRPWWWRRLAGFMREGYISNASYWTDDPPRTVAVNYRKLVIYQNAFVPKIKKKSKKKRVK